MVDGRPVRRLVAPQLLLLLLVMLPLLAQEIAEGLQTLSGIQTTTAISVEEDEAAEPGALVSDLRVETSYPPPQLKISWTPPNNETLPSGFQIPRGYEVSVYLLNESQPDCAKHSATFYSEQVWEDTTSLLVPPFVYSGMETLRVRAGCAYRVIVESDPYYGGPRAKDEFLVPNCSDACWCRTKPTPPDELAALPLPSGGRNVTWTLPPGQGSAAVAETEAAVGARYVRLELGEERFVSNSGKIVYEFTWNATVALPRAYGVVPARVLQPGRNYSVTAFVVDELGCNGLAANTSFQQPQLQQEPTELKSSNNSTAVWVAVALVAVAAALLVLLGICPRRGGPLTCKRGARGRPSSVYKFVNTDSHLMLDFPIHQERNIIYVEKEIEDARARGDADKFEISYHRLVLGRQIGKGAFGRVFLAQAEAIAATPGFHTVAVKKLKHRATPDEVEEFLSEIAMLKRVGRHPNIVTMLGCCTLKEPFCMIMEYVPCGDLLQYLRRMRVEYERTTWSHLRPPAHAHALRGGVSPLHSPTSRTSPRYVHLLLSNDSEGSYIQPESQLSATSGPSIPETEWSLLSSEGEPQTPTEEKRPTLECVLDPKEMQNFAVQIARGMSHLEMKQITHRDLAARNVLIDENKTLKISDFGLSRSGIYINTKRKKVPLRWLSVEAMRDNLYSSKSDVWAFAIVLWEIGTLGGFPYPTVADMNLLTFLMEGKRLEKPDNCSDELYSLMLRCWSYSQDARPSFAELVQHLDSVICRKRVYVDFSNLSPNYTFPPTEQQAVQETSHSETQQQVLSNTKSKP